MAHATGGGEALEGKADALSTFVYGYVIVYGAERERASELVAAASSAMSN